jgi:hypothetical protein
MKLHLDKIINIKSKSDLDKSKFDINKPIFYDNYLFHYLIILNKLDILKHIGLKARELVGQDLLLIKILLVNIFYR